MQIRKAAFYPALILPAILVLFPPRHVMAQYFDEPSPRFYQYTNQQDSPYRHDTVGDRPVLIAQTPQFYEPRRSTDDEDFLDVYPSATTRPLTMSRDDRTIQVQNQFPAQAPKWDFGFPKCRSFNRQKPLFAEERQSYDSRETFFPGCYRRTRWELGKIGTDFRNFYSRENFSNILLATGIHAALSNTSLDQGMTDWWQDRVRNSSTDRFSAGIRDLGTPLTIVPVSIVCLLYYSDRITDRVRFFDTPVGGFVGDFASRATRAYLVGTPTMLLGQLIIGAQRPSDPNASSRWAPFENDHGVSGHAFVGAMPFITLAQMSDNFWLKATFYTCSTFVAWSRYNDNQHYLSQCLMGWYLAYLSCRAVSKTEYRLLPRDLTVFPILESRSTGVGLIYQW